MVTSFDLIYYSSSFDAWVKSYGHLKLLLLFIKCYFLILWIVSPIFCLLLFFMKKIYWLNIDLNINNNIRWFQKELRNEIHRRKQHQQVQKTPTLWCQKIDHSLWYGEFGHLIKNPRKRSKNIPKQYYEYSYYFFLRHNAAVVFFTEQNPTLNAPLMGLFC